MTTVPSSSALFIKIDAPVIAPDKSPPTKEADPMSASSVVQLRVLAPVSFITANAKSVFLSSIPVASVPNVAVTLLIPKVRISTVVSLARVELATWVSRVPSALAKCIVWFSVFSNAKLPLAVTVPIRLALVTLPDTFTI